MKERNEFDMTPKTFIKKFTTILFLMAVLAGCMVWNVTFSRQFITASANVRTNTVTTSTGSALDGIQGVWIAFYEYQSAGL